MASIAGIRLSRSGPVLYFETGSLEIDANDLVVVETADGECVGRIAFTPDQLILVQLKEPVRSVLRLATEDDLTQNASALL